jgi:hypothetical protein
MKNLKISIIAAAMLVPFAIATAAPGASTPVFASAKIKDSPENQASTDAFNAAAVVNVTVTLPEQPAGVIDTLKAKVSGKNKSVPQELHGLGVYVGKGLVLADNSTFVGAGKYRVTLADGRSIEASVYREGGGLMLLRVAQLDGLPEPVKVAANRPATGDNVTVFGAFDLYGGPRHTVMARGYVSAQAIPFYSDPTAPTLVAVKTDRETPKTEFGPVFRNGQLVGVTVISQHGETYMVPADYFAPRLTKVFAEI